MTSFSSEYQTLKESLRGRPHESAVIFPGFLADDDLAALLNRSSMLVLPSLMEGLGLPALEAAACGIPTVVTSNSPLPELLGDGAVAVDPLSETRIAEAIARLLDSDEFRAATGRAALAAARRLSSRREARALRDLLREMTGPTPLRHEQTA